MASRDDGKADDELMSRVGERDGTALATLFDRYHRRVYHFVRHLTGRPDLAEEMLQETFLTLARSADRYEPRGQFAPWLLRIARNLCLNHLAAERVRHPPRLSDITAPWPGEQLERQEQLAQLESALGRLPPRQREAIVLYAMQEMDYRQIAQVMETPINTVKTLIHRARATLAREMGSDGSGG